MGMKILITGASGLLGRAVLKTFREQSQHDIVGLARSRVAAGLEQLDLLKHSQVERFLYRFRPNVIIHSAAVRTPDTCENDWKMTREINVFATRFLAQMARRIHSSFIYISTDYVFPGNRPPYSVHCQPDPLNSYGRSKWLGELTTLSSMCHSAIVRVPVLYGPVERLEESAVTELARCLRPTDHPIKMDNWATRYPTHVKDVATVLLGMTRLAEVNGSIPQGIFHCSADQPMTKYQMAITMAEVLHMSCLHLEANDSPPAGPPRPQNTQLDISSITELGLHTEMNFYRCIRDIIAPFF